MGQWSDLLAAVSEFFYTTLHSMYYAMYNDIIGFDYEEEM
jgi:hypothetical protein